MSELRVEQRRGFAWEGSHVIDAVACDAEGRIVAQVGEDLLTTFRSAAKPFQLETSLSLLSDAMRGSLSSKDLALGAASHHGEAVHVAQVQSLLSRLGRGAEHLYCGAHPPSNAASAEALFARGEHPTPLHNNCAGKHSFMAGACLACGYAPDYRAADHPLQQRMLARMQERAGGSVVGTVTDGCGVPCFVLPLSGMARAWAQLARATQQGTEALGHIGRAMREHPLLMSGTEAFDGWIIQNAPVVAKVGALGLLCIAVPERGVGLAIKARSGSDLVRPAAALAVLSRLFPELLPQSVPDRFRIVTNVVGAAVGEHVAVWS